MDAVSLRVGQADPRADDVLKRIDVDQHAALLVEYQASTADEVAALGRLALPALTRLPLSSPAALASDPASRARLWNTRKGLYAAVAGARPTGTTALLEDIVVPVPALLPTCERLIELFARHGYEDNVIFGHAKDGNIHFMLNERLEGGRMDRLLAFTDEMVELVLGFEGSLKAEHGTGRMMAPFVRLQYGDELHDVMKQVKNAVRPARRAEPGRDHQRRPRGPHPQRQGDADRRGGGRPVRGVRVLRARVPEPRPDHDATAADRAAPRDAGGCRCG